MAKSGEVIDRLLGIVDRLRGPDGCPWDREQTLDSLKPGLIEEAYEVIDAIDDGKKADLKEELGDLLLQIVMQSRICEESGDFAFSDVVSSVADKLVRRHPHVFGEAEVAGSGEVLRNWDAIKKAERQTGDESVSIISGIPRHLPALQKAYQVQKRAARAGFDWDHIDDVLDKLHEEIAEMQEAIRLNRREEIREELGDLFFSAVNVSRFLGHNPEELLDRNIGKFMRRFQQVEEKVHASGKDFRDYTPDELDAFWNEVKAEEL
jgi:MazG family protein